MVSNSAALVEGVAQALTWAINDPLGHSAWNTSVCHSLSLIATADCKLKRLRGERETMRAATVFDSSVVPPIGLDKYLMRLRSTFRCSDASFIAAFILVDRVLGYDGGRLPLSMRNVHRLFLASLVVAVKYHEDLVYTNSHYAKAGGVHLREVNRLERVILAALDFDLRVPPEQYQIYEASLASLCCSGAAGGSGQAPQTQIAHPSPPSPTAAPVAAMAPAASATQPTPAVPGPAVEGGTTNQQPQPPSPTVPAPASGEAQAATCSVVPAIASGERRLDAPSATDSAEATEAAKGGGGGEATTGLPDASECGGGGGAGGGRPTAGGPPTGRRQQRRKPRRQG